MTTHTNTSVLCRSCKPNPVRGREDSDTLGGSPQKLQRQVVITIHFTCRWKATTSSFPSQYLESFPLRRTPSRRISTRAPTRSTTPTPTFPGGSTSGRRCVRSQAGQALANVCRRKCFQLSFSLRFFIPRTASTTLWCWSSFSNR